MCDVLRVLGRLVERRVIRWALRRVRARPVERWNYRTLDHYGIADASRDQRGYLTIVLAYEEDPL